MYTLSDIVLKYEYLGYVGKGYSCDYYQGKDTWTMAKDTSKAAIKMIEVYCNFDFSVNFVIFTELKTLYPRTIELSLECLDKCDDVQ